MPCLDVVPFGQICHQKMLKSFNLMSGSDSHGKAIKSSKHFYLQFVLELGVKSLQNRFPSLRLISLFRACSSRSIEALMPPGPCVKLPLQGQDWLVSLRQMWFQNPPFWCGEAGWRQRTRRWALLPTVREDRFHAAALVLFSPLMPLCTKESTNPASRTVWASDHMTNLFS